MKKLIIENENLTKNVKELQEMGYKYIVKAQDKFLSGWGCSTNKKHVQLIACRDIDQLEKIKHDLYNDKTMTYVKDPLSDNTSIRINLNKLGPANATLSWYITAI